MPQESRLSRRSALRIGVMGSAIAFGHPVFVAQGHAQSDAPHDETKPMWTALVAIDRCPISSANVRSLIVDPLNFNLTGGGKPAGSLTGRAIIRFGDAPQVYQEIHAWLQDAARRKLSRKISMVLMHREGGRRTFTLADAFPTRFNHVDIAAEGNAGAVMAYELEVRVDKVEMA